MAIMSETFEPFFVFWLEKKPGDEFVMNIRGSGPVISQIEGLKTRSRLDGEKIEDT